MSKVDYSALDEYSESDAVNFNDIIEDYLSRADSKDDVNLKKAVSYFYLLAYKMENTTMNAYGVVDILRLLVGKTLTVVDASILDKQQNKAVKDIIRQTYYSLIGNVKKEIGYEYPVPVPELRESDPII